MQNDYNDYLVDDIEVLVVAVLEDQYFKRSRYKNSVDAKDLSIRTLKLAISEVKRILYL